MVDSTFKRIFGKYKRSGILGLFIIAIKKSRLFNYFVIYYFYRVPLESLIKDIKQPSNVSVKVVSYNEGLEELLKVKDKRDIFKSRFDKGNFAILLYYDDVPVGYVWGQLDSPHYEERYGFVLRFQQDDAYSFDSYIDSGYRGLGLRRYLLKEFIRFSREENGKRNLTAIIEINNINSVNVHEGMGYRRVSLQVAFNFLSRDFQYSLRRYKFNV